MTQRAMTRQDMTSDGASDLGFALLATALGAVTPAEFGRWCERVVIALDTPPPILFDLMDLRTVAEAYAVLSRPRAPCAGLNPRECNALTGIGLLRGVLSDTTPGAFDAVTPRAARAAVARCPKVVQQFRETFPFLDLADLQG